MPSTNVDGSPMMIINAGSRLTLVIGERTYQGTLYLRLENFQENWYIQLNSVEPGEPEEIQIYRIKKEESVKPEAN
jgi:hypothetical protein